MDLNLSDLGAFLAVARAKGFRDGARATGGSASGLSEAVRRMVRFETIDLRHPMRSLGPFDLVFLDADKTGYRDYYEAVLPKLTPRGLIAADNTLWSGRVLDPGDTAADTVAVRSFNDFLATDPRVVVVQTTVRDGVTLVRRAD